jgi:DNA-binding CsgD family transcriptional regulator
MNALSVLTYRQYEVAERLSWGAIKKEVANDLHISVRTVENHTREIYEKLGIRNVAALSALYFCSRFNISLELSPLTRQALATMLLIVFCACMTIEVNTPYLRARRIEEIRERPRRNDDLLIII